MLQKELYLCEKNKQMQSIVKETGILSIISEGSYEDIKTNSFSNIENKTNSVKKTNNAVNNLMEIVKNDYIPNTNKEKEKSEGSKKSLTDIHENDKNENDKKMKLPLQIFQFEDEKCFFSIVFF